MTQTESEIDELLFRHYHDKSLIDEWASWWQKRSVLHKVIIASAIICIAGCIGTIIELSILFILFTSGIVYFLHSTLLQHDKHRRLYNEQCVTEIRDRTQKLNGLSLQLNAISRDVTKSQEEIKTHAETMVKNNNRVDIQTKQLIQKQENLHQLADSACEQTEKMEKAHDNLIKAAERLATTIQLASSNLDCAAQSRNQIESSLNLDKTLELQHQIELDIQNLSNGINTFIQQVSVLNCGSQAEFENSIENTRCAFVAVKELRAQHAATISQVENEASITVTMIANELLESINSDRDYQLSRLKTQNTLELVRKLRTSLLTAPLPNGRGSDFMPHPNQAMESEPRPLGRGAVEPPPIVSLELELEHDPAYEMSQRKSQHALALAQKLRTSFLTAPLPNGRGSDFMPHPNQAMESEPRPLESGAVEPPPIPESDSDIAYEMSRQRTRDTLAIVRARRAQLEQKDSCHDRDDESFDRLKYKVHQHSR